MTLSPLSPLRGSALGLALGLAALPAATPAQADGYMPYIGELWIYANSFCPPGWAPASGQLTAISGNEALFSLIGTTYGGDGISTFALPNMNGRSAIGQGQGPGLSMIVQGQAAGAQTVTLTQTQMPAHTHAAMATLGASENAATTAEPEPGSVLSAAQLYGPAPGTVALGGLNVSLGAAGGNQPVPIADPSLGLMWCIATEGIYPQHP